MLSILFEVVDQLNSRLPEARRLTKTAATVIAGDAATLESLEYINLVVEFEARLGDHLGRDVPLADRLVGDDVAGPPETLGALATLAVAASEDGGR